MARQGLSEILEETTKQSPEHQGEYLRRQWNPTLGQLIRYAYDGTFEWDLPEGEPPYTPNQFLDQESNLYTETRRLYVFMKGTGDHVPQSRKEMLFVQLLESLSKADAILLCKIKDGSLPYGITQEFIIKELPGQLVAPRGQDFVDVVLDTQEAPSFQEAVASDEGMAHAEVPVIDPTPTKKPVVKRKTRRKKRVVRNTKVADKED